MLAIFFKFEILHIVTDDVKFLQSSSECTFLIAPCNSEFVVHLKERKKHSLAEVEEISFVLPTLNAFNVLPVGCSIF